MDGFRLYKPRLKLDHDWQLRYGLHLLALTKWADMQTEATGEFVDVKYPTEEAFREMEATRRNRKLQARFDEVNHWKGKK